MNKKSLVTLICVIIFVVIGIIFAVGTGKYMIYIPSSFVVGGVLALAVNTIINNKEKNNYFE